MKKFSLKTNFSLMLIILSISLGVVVGSLIYPYKIVSGGILGISTLVLLYLFFIPSREGTPIEELGANFIRDIKYFSMSFLVALTGVCAIEYVIEFISYLYKFLINGF